MLGAFVRYNSVRLHIANIGHSLMHRHTKSQMERASRSSRVRGDNEGVPAVASLATNESTGSSMDSIDSRP